jgi:transcriptional regulator with XRE-family HTH domain
MKSKKCHLCNNYLVDTNIKGTVFPWKDFSFVELLLDFKALKCQSCGEIMIKGGDAAKLDEALAKSISMQASNFLQTLKQSSKLSQRELAKKIGISDVYFSKIIGMKQKISFQIFNYFKLLAKYPGNLNELNCFEGSCDFEHYPVQDLIDKFVYVEKERVEELEKERVFKGILSESRIIH